MACYRYNHSTFVICSVKMSLDKLMDAIADQGWYIWDDFLTPEQTKNLRACTPPQLQVARIGRHDALQLEVEIRNDKIQWIENSMGLPVQDYLQRMEQIRQEVNRHFFLGLFEYEAHFAKYEIGAFYQKHLDAFTGNASRKLTTVFYMNDRWCGADAGELVIYDVEDQYLATVAPIAGRLLVFLSERFPHEVQPTNAERFSIAGWFRINGVTGNKLDIAS
ncbi:SM-20 protein [Vibrio anguillarum]|uniref:SM-20 protein n=2 Tax=Vibrionaceae TaxID=641 RepID=A0AAW4B0Z1_VIBAN|nr:Proline hydroxylase family protein [Vibrio anguillarum 775]AGU59362.1 SM-20 [Vibrio anguillarum M3]ASF94205.1 SM-20 protein [Vibrio anguillarum]NAW91073.1 SM-20 protein [Vibrio sp. V24_P1S3T111]NAX17727.1 SM-20 protein [Vibrio sp. V22_P2S10T140]NNN96473.1 SM-20 protein [Vibrio sp. B4-6]OXX19935.1 SM-20 protein [Vibrio sp. V05_P4A8T149]OXX25859.1 SM-20 protein [Vibrio sp. V06_P1A73T115]OXX29715.1 SM-20 protein [Vibrio sp. V14_P6S14T42]OXX36882.1 SM-20 protein [Vibrio sp. V04_P4A5T148]OX